MNPWWRAPATAAAFLTLGCDTEPAERNYEAVWSEGAARREVNELQAMQSCVEAVKDTNLVCE